MDYTHLISKDQQESLKKARETYGNTAQMLVAAEECCELAAVCTKFPRYETTEKAKSELREKAIDEVADVLIILDHVCSVFDLSELEVRTRISGKIARLRGWLDKSDSMEQTTVDRYVPQSSYLDGDRFVVGGYADEIE